MVQECLQDYMLIFQMLNGAANSLVRGGILRNTIPSNLLWLSLLPARMKQGGSNQTEGARVQETFLQL